MPKILTPEEREQKIRRLRMLSRVLDANFTVPGTSFRFGLDPIIGLIPGVGDLITTGLSAYIIMEAHALGHSRATLLRMVINVGLDFLIGLIPLLGDLFDFAFKANARNLKLMGLDAAEEHVQTRAS